jgi:hypothetical protein
MGFFDRVLSNMKDYHLPILTGMFLVGSLEHHFKGLDGSFVAFTATIAGAITGHSFSPAQSAPDPPAPPTPPAS